MKGITLALMSGFLAATASLCGKFSMTVEKTIQFCELTLYMFSREDVNETVFSYSPFCQNIVVFARIAFFIAMLVCNATMWTIFTKSMRLCSTTLEATVINTASNFFFTAVYGQAFFSEALGLMWWFGTVLIILGLRLMNQQPVHTTKLDQKLK